MKKIIVIGGLSAGPSAAAKARREDENAKIILFEKGANISYATCGMPYALSGVIESRKDLIVVEPSLMRERFNIDVRLEEEVIQIETASKMVITNKENYEYDKLVFATGARSIVPPIEGIVGTSNWSTCRTMTDFDKIMKEAMASKAKNISVIGAGLIGVEVAENLVEAGKNVTLIEGADSILPMWDAKFGFFAQSELESKGIKVITGSFVHKFAADNDKIKSVHVGSHDIDTDFVILSIGIRPNTELLTSQGAKHGNGALIVNENMETSIKDVYAAGDNVSIKNLQTGEYDYFPLGTHSNKGGRAAGANVAGRNIKLKGAYKTAIIKVFDYTMARTGLNAKALKNLNKEYKTVLTIAGATPGYYPGKTDIVSEIYYDPKTKEILGGEFFGEVGVDKRVDVLSTAIYAKLKITDLSQLDLAYAPPFSPAKDPLVVAGFVAENINEDKCSQISTEDYKKFIETTNEDFTLIDVRNKDEYQAGHISKAINIPLPVLRREIELLDKGKKTIIYCQKGLRGYVARLILKHNGFENTVSIAGGFKIWEMMKEEVSVPEMIIEE